MYHSVQKVLQHNSASWNGLAAFENAVTRFGQHITLLEQLTYQKTKSMLGVKSKRDQKRRELAKLSLSVANAVYAYAVNIKDEKLKAEVKYNSSQLKYGKITTFLQLVNGLIAKANEHADAIAEYGVNQSMIDDLTLVYMEFVEIADLPRQATVSRKMITHQISIKLKDIDDVLKNQLDKLIVLFKDSAPEFVMTFEGARVIIDHRATRKPSKGSIGEDTVSPDFPSNEFDSSP